VEGGGVAADAVVASTYGDVAVGDLVVFIDSGDHVAVAVREGNALERFRDPSFLQIVAAD
jgi:S-adenosylmethionine hydrolase